MVPGDLDRYLDVWPAVWSTVICVVVTVVVAALCYWFKGAAVAARTAGWLLLAGSIVVVLAVTFLGRPMYEFQASGPFANSSNWVPFRDIVGEWHNVNQALGVVNVVGNVALFVPTGLLAGLLVRPRWAALLVAPVLSTMIEITQAYVGLSGDIDDVILNTLGGVIGVAVAALARRVVRRPAGSTESPVPAADVSGGAS